ncbi:MAG TPA: co-chaperone GroES [Erysipelotrichaceae bacterium]|jgi:chaperonin GroES|nr:co-chaperone GroES [Erysipelotrichaceae bacterium]HQA85688.1 co-chaperone GroES [Erysipelotrichaceae bacterium]
MIKPLNDNVLLKIATVETKTASGIILNVSDKEEKNIGIVIAVGDGKIVEGKQVLPIVKENDKVIFDKYAAIEVEYLNEKYLIVPETGILAVIE